MSESVRYCRAVAEESRTVSGRAGPTFEKFREGWVVVDPRGVISTPCPMSEETARGYARVLKIPFPGDRDD
jgi:hypothetical protein